MFKIYVALKYLQTTLKDEVEYAVLDNERGVSPSLLQAQVAMKTCQQACFPRLENKN